LICLEDKNMDSNDNKNSNDFVTSITAALINKRRTKKAIQKMEAGNEAKKGIQRYRSSEIEAFVNNSDINRNIIFSGTNTYQKNKVLLSVCYYAFLEKIPVIILHERNTELENELEATFGRTGMYTVINEQNPCYDPFYNIDSGEVEDLLFKSTLRDRAIAATGSYYIQGIADFIHAKGKILSTRIFITCPHDHLFDKIDETEKKKAIAPETAKKIKSALMQGQSERGNIERFFRDLESSGKSVLYQKNTSRDRTNIKEIAKQQKILSFDISVTGNNVLSNVALSEVENIALSGRKFVLIIDDIVLDSNEKMVKLVKESGRNYTVTISADDIFSVVGGDAKIFDSIVGKAEKCFIMRQSSGKSSEKWAEVIGHYEKEELTQSQGNHMTFKGGFGYGANNSYNVNIKNDYIVKPQEIQHMNNNDVYIFDKKSGSLSFTTAL